MLLEVDRVYAGYGRLDVLHGVSLGVEPGQLCSLVGSNGAGKTTLVSVISGLVPTTSGSIRFDGDEIRAVAPHKRVDLGIAHVPEGRWIFKDMTVEENLRIGGFRRKRSEIAREIERVFTMFPRLLERRGQRAGTMSGGEQQMTAIGRALMSAPRLLILDEPSLGLAPIIVRATLEAIRTICAEGISVLLVEQNVNDVLPISDKAFVIENGEIVIRGSGRELMNNQVVKNSYLGLGVC